MTKEQEYERQVRMQALGMVLNLVNSTNKALSSPWIPKAGEVEGWAENYVQYVLNGTISTK